MQCQHDIYMICFQVVHPKIWTYELQLVRKYGCAWWWNNNIITTVKQSNNKMRKHKTAPGSCFDVISKTVDLAHEVGRAEKVKHRGIMCGTPHCRKPFHTACRFVLKMSGNIIRSSDPHNTSVKWRCLKFSRERGRSIQDTWKSKKHFYLIYLSLLLL